MALSRKDRTRTLRPDIAQGKARGAIGISLGSRALFERSQVQPFFIHAMNALADVSLVPVAGGVLVKRKGSIIAVFGIIGDHSDNDEAYAIAATEQVGCVADGG